MQDGKLFLVFEYLNMDLRKYLDNLEVRMDYMLIKCFVYQILQGLLFCHLRRVIHRDLKPQNLLVDVTGKIIKLADFGLARTFGVPVKALTHEVTDYADLITVLDDTHRSSRCGTERRRFSWDRSDTRAPLTSGRWRASSRKWPPRNRCSVATRRSTRYSRYSTCSAHRQRRYGPVSVICRAGMRCCRYGRAVVCARGSRTRCRRMGLI